MTLGHLYLCAPFLSWPVKDTHEDSQTYFARVQNKPACPSPLRSGSDDDDLMRRTLAILKTRDVTVAVTDGNLEVMEKWKQASEGRILPALPFDPESGKPSVDELRQLVKSRRVMAFAEISSQYEGIAATDPRMEPYFALAEELDIPVGIHMGPGPPGAPYVVAPSYRMRLSSLLTLEDVLVRHPKLRVWAMHAGMAPGRRYHRCAIRPPSTLCGYRDHRLRFSPQAVLRVFAPFDRCRIRKPHHVWL